MRGKAPHGAREEERGEEDGAARAETNSLAMRASPGKMRRKDMCGTISRMENFIKAEWEKK